jgi:hypothetical protein
MDYGDKGMDYGNKSTDYGNNKGMNRRQIARAVLTRARVHDPLARGLAVGASAHGLGTASLVLAVRSTL